ncbi:MAG TPA: hypothetical protein PKI90_07640 [bacterium]|nr:hypothetical protein [bacterium]
MKSKSGRVMVLGGSGVMGFQVARRLARDLEPKTIIIVCLHQSSMRRSLERLRKEFPKVTFDGAWGNVFLRSSWHGKSPKELRTAHENISQMIADLCETPAETGKKYFLSELIHKYKPDIIVDAVPTAPLIAALRERWDPEAIARNLRSQRRKHRLPDEISLPTQTIAQIEHMLVYQPLPLLIQHVRILYEAMCEVGTSLYLKIGITGMGGMGFKNPYMGQHDRELDLKMERAVLAFGQTGLLFSMARTPGAPVIKEVKIGALVGSRLIDYRTVEFNGSPVGLFHAKKITLADKLPLFTDVGYARRGDLSMVGIQTASAGFLTQGEFEAVTTLFQMEYLTPEEVAHTVIMEIQGFTTGYEVIAALDSAVMDPSYRAGVMRQPIIAEMQRLSDEKQTPSVALGQLGPPELSKLLYEAWLLRTKFRSIKRMLSADPALISQELEHVLLHHPIRHTIVSIGIPILLADGKTLLRGPRIKIPAGRDEDELTVTQETIDGWAKKGWVDLRPANMAKWQERIEAMVDSCKNFFNVDASDISRGPCPAEALRIGEMVGWVFNNDPAIQGFRVKSF